MPELPEVETVKRDLSRLIVGKKIKSLWTDHPKMLGLIQNSATQPISAPKFQNLIQNQKITRLARRAKNLLIELSNDQTLWVHLKMTGHLLYKPKKLTPAQHQAFNEDKYNAYIHLILHFTDGSQLAFSDLRKFGRLRLIPAKVGSIMKDPARHGLGPLGPEPLTKAFTPALLAERLKTKKQPIKLALMDQLLVAGIGNIYASEILYAARINPKTPANKLSLARVKKLHQAIQAILKRAVQLRGTSVSDFRDASGLKGRFAQALQVYGRHDKTCNSCKGHVKRIKQGQRSTFYCPVCQK